MLPAIYDFWFEAFKQGESWAVSCSFLNLFQYITFRAASAGLLAFILSLIIGPRVIRKLISLKVSRSVPPRRSTSSPNFMAEKSARPPWEAC